MGNLHFLIALFAAGRCGEGVGDVHGEHGFIECCRMSVLYYEEGVVRRTL